MRNGYILSGSKWHTQNISFWRLQIFCLCSLFCFEQNRDTFLFVFAGSKLCTILVILFRVLLVTKVNNLPRYCAAQSAKPNLEVLSRTRTKARFCLLFTVLFSTIPSISSSEALLNSPIHPCIVRRGGTLLSSRCARDLLYKVHEWEGRGKTNIQIKRKVYSTSGLLAKISGSSNSIVVTCRSEVILYWQQPSLTSFCCRKS